MADDSFRILLRQLRRATGPAGEAAPSDAQLLERFVTQRDEAAFELLVWRHGTMVLNLCRRMLRHDQDAEDAFQATFLVLAHKAASISKRTACASWLYKVAYRVALAARSEAAARGGRECSCPDDLPAAQARDELLWRDLRPVLDEEVSRLPEKYRAAFVLCCLQGRTSAEAAEQLGCPEGTVLSRLSRARERMRRRLLGRGVCLSAGLLAAVVAANGQAAEVTAGLVGTTSRAALAVAAGKAVAAASARAAALTQGALRAMFMTKLKMAGGLVLTVALIGAGAGLLTNGLLAEQPPKPKPTPGETVRRSAVPDEPTPSADRKAESGDAAKEALRRLQTRNNLRQIGIALQNYASAYGQLPAPAIYDKNGKPLLSWRVALLPFIDQDNLYKQFKLDEPWNSEHNKPLSDHLIKVYAPPDGEDREKPVTYYQAIVGQGAAWEPRKPMRFPASFIDGTSNTILVVEAATPVPWAKPEDLAYVPDQALPKFGGLFGGAFHALFADGAVHFLSGRADEATLRAAITPAGGEVIDFDKLLVTGSKGPGARVSLEELPALNRDLREAIDAVRKDLAKERDELELLKARIATGAPAVDAKTAQLLKENAELQKMLEKALEELGALRDERQRLRHELDQPAKRDKVPTKKP
jgi:RNA polymerase sigma factor (sigma-70 family)